MGCVGGCFSPWEVKAPKRSLFPLQQGQGVVEPDRGVLGGGVSKDSRKREVALTRGSETKLFYSH